MTGPHRAAARTQAAPLEIRPATLDDLDALIELENASFPTDRLSRRSFREFLQKGRATLLVAERSGALEAYALTIYRQGAALARLYSIAVAANARGSGAARALMLASEDAAREHDCILMRLEVNPENAPAIRLYETLGYRLFGRHLDYYDDHSDALRYQKRLLASRPGAAAPAYYAQTTDFTCGPAAMMMAIRRLRPDEPFERTEEFRLWREATTVFMQAGHGGCEPVGMAVAMARRGLDVSVHVNQPGPYFVESVRSADRRDAIRLIQADYAVEARRLDVPIQIEAMTVSRLADAVSAGAGAIVLVSHYEMVGSRTPHWVYVYGWQDGRFLVHDPWVEPDKLETVSAASALPIPAAAFDRMARWGRARLRAAILIHGLKRR